jgi:hypothetical protein
LGDKVQTFIGAITKRDGWRVYKYKATEDKYFTVRIERIKKQ